MERRTLVEMWALCLASVAAFALMGGAIAAYLYDRYIGRTP